MSFFDKLKEIENLESKGKLNFWKEIKAQLEHKLSKLEAQTHSVSEWIDASEKDIVIAYNELYSSLSQRDEEAIKTQLSNMGDIAGIVLQIPIRQAGVNMSFSHLITINFGPESEVSKLAADVKLGIPETVYTNLLGFEDEELEKEAPSEEKTSFWGKISGKDQERIENELELAKKELLSLQTEVPYYVDSFCDWLESGLDMHNDFDTSDEENEKRLKSYQDPDYMINAAEQDFNETISTFSERVFDISQDYAQILRNVESKNPSKIIDSLTKIKSTKYADKALSWVFEELNVTSLHELALDKFEDNQIRSKLFEEAMSGDVLATPIEFQDSKRMAKLFDEIFNECLKTDDPMPLSTLFIMINNNSFVESFDDDKEKVLQNLLLKLDDKTGKSYFEIVDNLEDKELKTKLFELFSASLGFTGITNSSFDNKSIPKLYIDLKEAIANKDSKSLQDIIILAKELNVQDEVIAFYGLLNKEQSIPMHALSSFDNKEGCQIFNNMAYHGYEIFLKNDTDEYKIEALEKAMLNVGTGISTSILTPELEALKNILQYIQEEKGSEFIKDIIISSNIIEHSFKKFEMDDRNSFLSVILNSFNNIEKSNILSRASLDIQDTDLKKNIQDVANLYSGYYQSLNDRLIINPENLGNIWHANQNLMNASKYSSFNQKIGEEEMDINIAAEYLSALYKNDDFVVFGTDEITNKNHIKYAWFAENNGDTAVHFIVGDNKTSTSMDAGDAELTIGGLIECNSYVYVGGYAINLDNIGYLNIDKQSDQLNILDNADEIETIDVSPEEISYLLEIIKNHPDFIINEGNDQAVNTSKVDLLINNEHTDEVSFVIENNYFGSEFAEIDEDGLKTEYIDGFMNSDKSNLLEEFENSNQHIKIGDKCINIDNLSYTNYDEESDTLELIISNERVLIHVEDFAAVEEINAKLKDHGFITNEIQAIKPEKTANIWFTSNDDGEFIACLMPNKSDKSDQIVYMQIDDIEETSNKILAVGKKEGFFIVNNELLNFNKLSSIALNKDVNLLAQTIKLQISAGSSKTELAMSYDDYQDLIKGIADLGSIKNGNSHEKISDLHDTLSAIGNNTLKKASNTGRKTLLKTLRENNQEDPHRTFRICLDNLRQSDVTNDFTAYKDDLVHSNDNRTKPEASLHSNFLSENSVKARTTAKKNKGFKL